jgi:hypothetical protein
MKAAIATFVLALVVIGSTGRADAASFNRNWTRYNAQNDAFHGLRERYTFGGSKFINNDRWDAACTSSCTSTQEGIDCSGFAAKVYAVPYQTPETTVYHPYPTFAFYYVGKDGYGPTGSYPYHGGRFWYSNGNNRTPYWMDIWVWDHRAGGPSDHMGVFRGRNSDGTWMTREARGSAYGVVEVDRSLGDMIRWHYKRVQRSAWGRS